MNQSGLHPRCQSYTRWCPVALEDCQGRQGRKQRSGVIKSANQFPLDPNKGVPSQLGAGSRVVVLCLHSGPWLSNPLAFGAAALRLGFSRQGRQQHFLLIRAVQSNLLILEESRTGESTGSVQQAPPPPKKRGGATGGRSEPDRQPGIRCHICLSVGQRQVGKDCADWHTHVTKVTAPRGPWLPRRQGR